MITYFTNWLLVNNTGAPYESAVPYTQVFGTLNAAIQAAIPGTFIGIVPGTYNLNDDASGSLARTEITKTCYIQGLGQTPEEVLLTRSTGSANRNALNWHSGVESVVENVWIRGAGTSGDNVVREPQRAESIILNKVILDDVSDGAFLSWGQYAYSGDIIVQNCTIRNVGYLFNAVGWITASRWKFRKTESSRDNNHAVSEWDVVSSPADGYGHQYGSLVLSPLAQRIESRAINTQGRRASRVCVFLWDNPSLSFRVFVTPGGEWHTFVPYSVRFGVYYQGAGMQPRIEGPYLSDEAPS